MPEDPKSFAVPRLGACAIASPMRDAHFVKDEECVLCHDDVAEIRPFLETGQQPPAFELAGPREKIFFEPEGLRCGIVTCGGLCPGLNDGEHLERTVRDLAALYPGAQSIAVVPVGLTKYRDIAIADIVPVTEAKAREVVGQVKGWQREFRRNLGVGLVYLGDEFYFLAGHPFPSGRSYDGYPQYENGVGLVRTLLDEAARLRRKWGTSAPAGGRTMVACGTRIAPLLREVLDELGPAIGWDIAVVPVENRFFGPSVNVSGLLTGGDVVEALRGKGIGDVLVLPRAMLDDGCERFLDNMTPFDMQRELSVPVVAAGSLCQLAQVLANRGWLCAA